MGLIIGALRENFQNGKGETGWEIRPLQHLIRDTACAHSVTIGWRDLINALTRSISAALALGCSARMRSRTSMPNAVKAVHPLDALGGRADLRFH